MTVVSLTPPDDGSAVDGLSGFVHRYSAGNGAHIHYVVGGAGPAVLLLHGFAYTWEDWRRILQPLADAGFTAIAPDLRGMGYSALTKDGYSKANIAEDNRAIVHELGFAEVNLVGGAGRGCFRAITVSSWERPPRSSRWAGSPLAR